MNSVNLTDPSEVHWVTKYLFARTKMNEYKALAEEAKEEWLALVGDDWDVVKVNGRPVFEASKTNPKKFSVAALKEKYPEIYQELTKPVPQTSIKVIE